MRNKRNPWILLLILLFGALVGGVSGEALSKIKFFEWMSFGGIDGYRDLISFNLQSIDFRILKVGFDFSMRVNAGSLIGIVLAFLVYTRF